MENEMLGGASFQIKQKEAWGIFKVFLWTMASALVVLAIDWLGMVEVPAQYTFLVPMANTILYALKEFIADNR